MLREDANPIEMAVALLDDTSVGLAHRLQEFNMLKRVPNKLYVVW